MKRAKFSYIITTQGSRACLVITDNRKPSDNCMSVTQDIDRVVEQIEIHHQLHAENFVVVYCDTEGVWDGWNARTQKFVLLNCQDWPAAVSKYVAQEFQPQHA